jgi:hypothetical protein
VVDVMGRDLEEYLNKNINLKGKTVYALRGSTDDERRAGWAFFLMRRCRDTTSN